VLNFNKKTEGKRTTFKTQVKKDSIQICQRNESWRSGLGSSSLG